MGRGRAKAKQTKVARDLKYSSQDIDIEKSTKELHGEVAQQGRLGQPDGADRLELEARRLRDGSRCRGPPRAAGGDEPRPALHGRPGLAGWRGGLAFGARGAYLFFRRINTE